MLLSPRPLWLTATPRAGRLLAGQNQDVALGFDARGLPPGSHASRVLVRTNDPARPEVVHPVRLDVTGAPAIEVKPGAVDFGAIVAGSWAERAVEVRNIGSRTLSLAAIQASDPAVTVDVSPFSLPPAGAKTFLLRYAPATPGSLDGALLIRSDSAGTPEVSIPLSGTALPPAEVQVSPPVLEVTLPIGGTTERTLRITNNGSLSFPFEVRTEERILGVSADKTPAGGPVVGFERLPSSPAPVGCLVEDAENGTIYALEYFGASLYRFHLATRQWEKLAPVPGSDVVGWHCNGTILNGHLYMRHDHAFHIVDYDVAAGSWSTIPNPLGRGYPGTITTDGTRLLYVGLGSLLASLDPATGVVEQLPSAFPYLVLRPESSVTYSGLVTQPQGVFDDGL